MALRPCLLSHAIHLVIVPERFQWVAETYPTVEPPDRAKVQGDLDSLVDGGVPAFLHTDRDDNPAITFCTPRYEIRCGQTHNGDGYYAYGIAPLSLRSHNEIARRAVLVSPRRWAVCLHLSDIDRSIPAHSGFGQIRAVWDQIQKTVPRPHTAPTELTPAQSSFLSDIETLIDLACEVEQDKALSMGLTLVTHVEPTAKARTANDAYRFHLAEPSALTLGDYVRAGWGEPGRGSGGHTGVIIEVASQSLVVRFHQFVDWDVIQGVEWLVPSVSTKQYRIQQAAVHALRERRSMNPALLPAIVEGWFTAYQPSPVTQTAGQLNAAQREMIARAHTVPDILLALGPPGTGKTHTIRAIVRQQTEMGHKVLITSKNNKAVDNVLEALRGMDALRIGREEAVSAGVRPLMIDHRARELQAHILANTDAHFAVLQTGEAAWPDIQRDLDALYHVIMAQQQARAALKQAQNTLRDWQRARYGDIAPTLERQTQRFRDANRRAQRAVADAEELCQKMNAAAKYGRVPIYNRQRLAEWEEMETKRQVLIMKRHQAITEMQAAARNVQQVWERYHQIVTSGTTALQYKRAIVAAEQTLAQEAARVQQCFERLRANVARFADAPCGPEAAPTLLALHDWQRQLATWHEALLRRRDLLTEWRHLLKTRHQALYPTLIQTADVVGATCIGVATDARFEDLAFDLVVADEAGQIQVMDLLVPLVRAERAVLVGDDRQLPPVVEHEIQARLDADDETLQTWLEQSLFEQLFRRESTPASRKVRLDTQYRMPQIIADFISHHFYEDRYHTGRDIPHADPFFASPLVFVDTCRDHKRRERPAVEAEGIHGYINDLEADVIADLVLAYHEHGAEWGVIVPYKKQAEHIRRALRRQRASLAADVLQDWVATVDSFQGKERDVILYGFTRSNPRGRVGFLAELRRLNVSLTRAKHQLVLVGDTSTLTRAGDASLAHLMQALVTTVKTLPGGYQNAHDLRRSLR